MRPAHERAVKASPPRRITAAHPAMARRCPPRGRQETHSSGTIRATRARRPRDGHPGVGAVWRFGRILPWRPDARGTPGARFHDSRARLQVPVWASAPRMKKERRPTPSRLLLYAPSFTTGRDMPATHPDPPDSPDRRPDVPSSSPRRSGTDICCCVDTGETSRPTWADTHSLRVGRTVAHGMRFVRAQREDLLIASLCDVVPVAPLAPRSQSSETE